MFKFIRIFDRHISGSLWKQLLWLVAFIIFVFVLWFGLSFLFYKSPSPEFNVEINSRFWGIVSHLFDPGNLHMASPKLRVFTMLIAFSGSMVLGGLLISTFSNAMERRVDKIKNGHQNYRFNKHYIIIGYNDMVPALIKQLNEKRNKPDIVLLTNQEATEIRRTIKAKLPTSMEKRLTILHGSRDTQEQIQRLRVHRVLEIFIFGENEELNNDALNTECLILISDILEENKKSTKEPIPCYLLFHSQATFSTFQFKTLPDCIREVIDLRPYNFYEMWAQRVLVHNQAIDQSHNNSLITYKPLDYEVIDVKSNKSIHLIIAGFNRMASALLTETTRLAHFANGKTSRVTIISEDANVEKDLFKARYPLYEKIDDVEITFMQGSFESEEVRRKITAWSKEENTITTIAICFNNPNKCLSAALTLPSIIYHSGIPVIVHQKMSYSLISLLTLKDDKKGSINHINIQPFGMTDQCFNIDSDRDIMAKAVNYFYCNEYDIEEDLEVSKLDEEWNKLSLSDKWSNRYNTDSIPFKLRAIRTNIEKVNAGKKSDFTDEEVEILAQMEHARWNSERLLSGYIPPTKQQLQEASILEEEEYNKYKKELQSKMVHLFIVPFESLREKVRDIDRRLVRTIPKILKFNNEIIAIQKSSWTYQDFLAYLLLYAANADQVVTTEEKDMLLSKVTYNEYEHVCKSFDSENDTNHIETILSFRDKYFSTEKAKDKLFNDLEEMFLADEEYDSLEKAIFIGLRKIMI